MPPAPAAAGVSSSGVAVIRGKHLRNVSPHRAMSPQSPPRAGGEGVERRCVPYSGRGPSAMRIGRGPDGSGATAQPGRPRGRTARTRRRCSRTNSGRGRGPAPRHPGPAGSVRRVSDRRRGRGLRVDGTQLKSDGTPLRSGGTPLTTTDPSLGDDQKGVDETGHPLAIRWVLGL